MIFEPGKLYSYQRLEYAYDMLSKHRYSIDTGLLSEAPVDVPASGTFMYLCEKYGIGTNTTFLIVHFLEANVISMSPKWYFGKEYFKIKRL